MKLLRSYYQEKNNKEEIRAAQLRADRERSRLMWQNARFMAGVNRETGAVVSVKRKTTSVEPMRNKPRFFDLCQILYS